MFILPISDTVHLYRMLKFLVEIFELQIQRKITQASLDVFILPISDTVHLYRMLKFLVEIFELQIP